MAEQIIDIRERIEKMRIKFEDDRKSEIIAETNLKKNVSVEEKKEITNLPNELSNQKKEEEREKDILYKLYQQGLLEIIEKD